MTYKDGSDYKVQLADGNGEALAKTNEVINITIVGKTYIRLTDKNGIAKLSINLGAGTCPVTEQYCNLKITNKVTVKKT